MISDNLRENIPEKFMDDEVPSYSKVNYLVNIVTKIINFCLGHQHTGGYDGSILGKTSINVSSFNDSPGYGLVPQNAVIIWTGPTCPAGFSEANTSAVLWSTSNRYLHTSTIGDGSFGGSVTHTHTLILGHTHTSTFTTPATAAATEHSHTFSLYTWPNTYTSSGSHLYAYDDNHTHTNVSGTTLIPDIFSGEGIHNHEIRSGNANILLSGGEIGNNELQYIGVLFCKKD